MCTATSEIRPNIRAVVAIKVLTVIIIVILSNFLFNKIMLQPLLIAFLLNCTAKLLPFADFTNFQTMKVLFILAFLTAVNSLDGGQFFSHFFFAISFLFPKFATKPKNLNLWQHPTLISLLLKKQREAPSLTVVAVLSEPSAVPSVRS